MSKGYRRSKKFLVRRFTATTSWLSLAAVSVGIVIAVGAATASGASPRNPAMPHASGQLHSVIVLLRDKAAGAKAAARTTAVRSEVAPLARLLRSEGATHVSTGKALPIIYASVSSAQQAALAAKPAVRAVIPNQTFKVSPPASGNAAAVVPNAPVKAAPRYAGETPGPCGTSESPESDPEALGVINATAANNLGYDGAGVTVAYIAEGIDTSIPDFQRNAAYASDGHGTGTPVVTEYNFSADPAADQGAGLEAFLDASSIAAQGNTVYDLSSFVNSSNPLPSGCDIKITGAAPGASVMGLDVFSNDYQTTTSNFVQAIEYAVDNGVNVINESFGGNPFPDTANDAIRIADEDAVTAGVTVVVSSGDAGITSTIGSPATDPGLISAGASTTFRAYRQETYGGINASSPNSNNNTWLDNNISGLSSGGFSQSGGNTVDLVAPGDLNWIDCDTATCKDENGNPTAIALEGGTSESAPLTAAAAADVIQAYRAHHAGASPTPATIKQILMSTATDIYAPAEQQGAGLLNILGAVKEAASINGASGTPQGSLENSPNQINITQNPSATTTTPVSVTNTGNSSVTVHLSTRALTTKVASPSGSFCLRPTSAATNCGPVTSNTFPIWSGVTEVYQEETFTVPNTHGAVSRLNFSATYPYSGQSSLLHVALYDPNGAYAGYSIPQGLADYANVQVANPVPGTWTAVFFTQQADNATQGVIQWEADTWTYGSAGTISPSTLNIPAGGTGFATFKAKSPANPGDTAQSIVLNSSDGTNTTIPVTVRTLARVRSTFNGVLTGGNGRAGAPAATNTYSFNVPGGQNDIDATVNIPDSNNAVVAYLIDPEGNSVASSSNYAFDGDHGFACCDANNSLTVYQDNPEKGQWTLVLDWLNAVSGDAISMPFSGSIEFNKVSYQTNLPHSNSTKLMQGHSYLYYVYYTNNTNAQQVISLDPRTTSYVSIPLNDLSGSETNMTLPPDYNYPVYGVPADTTELDTSLTSADPVTYDLSPFPGDPDMYASGGDNPTLDFSPLGGEVTPGIWALVPSEVGPYGDEGGDTSQTATASASAWTPNFDSTVETETGDLWTYLNTAGPYDFEPAPVDPGDSVPIGVLITPTATPGTHVSGTMNVDDVFTINFGDDQPFASGDELASIPIHYTVKPGP